ncbi:Arylsulfatase G [Seminavis robusta]|uniref:Arylsulfatase G n=1 Tax=Seminavis robusta TaxID=568900 RepID=A0A9N8HP36_9STRA|nr:Arylsulfatase G [Seminavis robusta]|eukprot:Sro1034_g233850.1 Arylsulfatase G (621) ;mRNA; f:22122-23984
MLLNSPLFRRMELLVTACTWMLLLLSAANARPNIIVMQPDDFQFFTEWDPPAHRAGATLYSDTDYLPHLTRFRANGLEMKRAYTASSMCGTSRYSTMTGRYPSRSSNSRQRNAGLDLPLVTIPTTKLVDIATDGVEDGLDCSVSNVAVMLQSNGYRTGMFGKWHLYAGNRGDPYDYSAIQSIIRSCGFDVAEAVYWQNLNDDWTNGGRFTHNLEHMAAEAIEFIDASLDAQQDFFMYFNPTAPHGSGNVFQALTQHSCQEAPEGTLPEEPVVPGMTGDGVGCQAYRQSVVDRANGDTSNAILGAIWVDDTVGALLQHLETRGILENTLFLFQLDHGQEAKSTLYEPGVRIAQFIHYPKEIPAGSTFEGLVSTIDIAPTLADYAGISESSSNGWYETDGVSWKDRWARPVVDDRCLLVELDYDRAVVCKCEKYLVIGSTADSTTLSRATRFGLVGSSPASFDLCDGDGAYRTSPDNSPEASVADTIDSRLEDLMDCHVAMTDPDETPAYGTCNALALGPTPAPTTAEAEGDRGEYIVDVLEDAVADSNATNVTAAPIVSSSSSTVTVSVSILKAGDGDAEGKEEPELIMVDASTSSGTLTLRSIAVQVPWVVATVVCLFAL